MSATEATVVAVTEEVKAVEPPAAEPTPATDAPSADQPAAVTEAAPATVCLPFTVLTCLILFFFLFLQEAPKEEESKPVVSVLRATRITPS